MEVIQSKAQSLPPRVRFGMEYLFGADFSGVRIYPESPSARQLGARAFASGDSIYFASGEYQPDTADGWSVIGHELAHILQQRHGLATGSGENEISVVNDPDLEREAENAGEFARLVHSGTRHARTVRLNSRNTMGQGGLVVQCLMSLREFQVATGFSSGAFGFRNNILDVENSLSEFNQKYGAVASSPLTGFEYKEQLKALNKLLDACNKYQGSRSQGVRTLVAQIMLEKRFLELTVGATSGVVTDRLDSLDKASELARGYQTMDWSRRRSQIEGLYRRLAPSQNIAEKVARHDVEKITQLATAPNMPATLQKVIHECVNAFAAAEEYLKFQVGRAGMAPNDESGMLWKIRFDDGRTYRLGQVVHELTHLSTALKFRWTIMLCLPLDADDVEIEGFAVRRSKDLERLKGLVDGSGLPESWVSLFKGQIRYAAEATAFDNALNAFKPQIGDQFDRFKKLIQRGKVHSELHEYDTVINQMAMWCFLLSNKSSLNTELLQLAEQAYNWRAKYTNGIGGEPKLGLVRRVFGK